MNKMKDYKKFKASLLKDKAIKKAYDALAFESALIETLIRKRLESGFTQKELAIKLGTKQPVISRLEKGIGNPTVLFLKRVANALDATLEISIH